MAMMAPSGGGQAQMVLCGMVVNPDGTVAGAGPVGQLPPGTIPAGTLPPGTLAPHAQFPGTSQSALDPATIAAWGAATMMHGMGKCASGKGGMPVMQQPQHFQGQPGFSQSFATPGKGAAMGGRNRGSDQRTDSDWESLGRQRHTGVSEVPKPNFEGQNFQQNFGRNFTNFSSEGSQQGKGQSKGRGFSTFQTNTPAFTNGSGQTPEPKAQGRYSQPFADPTSEDDWALLGRQRENPEVPMKPVARSIHSITEEDADEAKEDEIDEDWNKLFESKGKGNETSKVFDSATLRDLKLKVEKPVMTDMDRDADTDWAMPVPEEDLEWISAAAKAAEAALVEEKPIPVLGTREAIALAQREAEERYFATERLSRRQQSWKEEEPRNADEARHSTRSEEFRELQASEAKQERQREIEEMKRQDQRVVEREAKLASRAGAPKMSWAAARASRQGSGGSIGTGGSIGSGGSIASPASDPDSYRVQQAALARAERERELKLIASLHERDAEREARIMSRPTGGS